MPHRPWLCTISLAVVALIPACGKDQLQGPEAEVKKSDIKPDLPAVPGFEMPAAPADGSHTVKELRVKGKKLLDTDITVHGYITWAYDCLTAVRKADEKEADAKKRIEDDPTLCERAKFYIGDDKTTPPEKSLWVVDVPRPYNKLEIKNMEKKDRHPWVDNKCEPNEHDPKLQICPPYAVGDEVQLTGSFKTSSPHSERNSDGLLVYKNMKNITQNWQSPEPPPPGDPNGPNPAPAGGPPAALPGGPARPSPQDIVNGSKKK
ncbi:MAG TPA: hypothetical protein VGF94_16240 [Kofleriaceae bacterium]|jgi:hypothetical protein